MRLLMRLFVVGLLGALVVTACQADSAIPTTTSNPTSTSPVESTTTSVQPVLPGGCDVVVAESGELASVIENAADEAVVCLAAGEYGDVEIDAKRSSFVTIRSLEPLSASFDTIVFDDASYVRFEQIVISGRMENGQDNSHHIEVAGSRIGGVFVQAPPSSSDGPGPTDWVIEYNDIPDCTSFCVGLVSADPAEYWPVSDMTVRGNKMGPMAGGEDAIRIHNWRDILIEDNEIFGVIETGDHNDCFQSVWGGERLVMRRNYLHDNNCQTFFLKDGYVTDALFEENLSLRNRVGDAPVVAQVWASSSVVIRNNTLWDESALSFRNGTYSDMFTTGPNSGHQVIDNVITQFVPYDDLADDSDRAGIYEETSVLVEDRNVLGGGWTWVPSSIGPNTVVSEAPAFISTSASRDEDLTLGDWRLAQPITTEDGAFTPGITWPIKGRSFGIEAYTPQH